MQNDEWHEALCEQIIEAMADCIKNDPANPLGEEVVAETFQHLARCCVAAVAAIGLAIGGGSQKAEITRIVLMVFSGALVELNAPDSKDFMAHQAVRAAGYALLQALPEDATEAEILQAHMSLLSMVAGSIMSMTNDARTIRANVDEAIRLSIQSQGTKQ